MVARLPVFSDRKSLERSGQAHCRISSVAIDRSDSVSANLLVALGEGVTHGSLGQLDAARHWIAEAMVAVEKSGEVVGRSPGGFAWRARSN